MLKILQYPNPRLKTVAKRVETFDDELQKIIDEMFLTHYNTKNCAALAATQLDLKNQKHITVIDFSLEKNQPLCLVNAEIIERIGKCAEEEGCMSVGGGTFEKISRAAKIKVRAQDRYGKPLKLEADGFMAKCIQHELDHLNGIIFLDHLSSLKRSRIDKRLEKLRRHYKSSENMGS
ncbi:peptide deformylase [Candidatus Coxiella mudrowiae]|uniref:Peptide deformylase n=1 Tax=Candidatus Coxiella mudrowiae TaxID=2054173 RepID=A0ABN4HR11_9COXI|nr:peptide deformylase [Candidatus Coxiella mudrowiae]AKQ33686.1 Peptide deformylase [Candidatus Coxiella mudrowiae]